MKGTLHRLKTLFIIFSFASLTACSVQERVIAEAMFMGGRGSLAKTTKEAHELYLKQKRLTSRAVAVED